MKLIGIVKRLFIVILLVYVVFVFLPRPSNVEGSNPMRVGNGERPLLIAHGGGNHDFHHHEQSAKVFLHYLHALDYFPLHYLVLVKKQKRHKPIR